MQNSDLKKEILGRHSQVSAQELEKYHRGELSGDKARAVEMKMHSNAFSAEAAEGFSTYGSGTPISEAGSPWKSKGQSWMGWSAVVIIGLVSIGVVTNSLLDSPDNQANHILNTIEEDKQVIPTENKVEEEKQSVVNSELQTETAKPASPNPVKEPESTEEKQSIPVLFSGAMEDEIFQISRMESKAGDITLKNEPIKAKSQKVRLRHYRNYKLVDQNIGLDQSRLKPILDNSPPFSETIVVNPEIPEWVPADSVYKITLNKAIDLLIDKKYGDAQMKLERLVENNSTDLTATFYLGYVLYLRDNFEEALVYFNKTESHIIQTYDQDARFLELKSLLALGRNSEAKAEADYLISVGSFYADKAKDLVY